MPADSSPALPRTVFETLRRHESDRFLAALFAPAASRSQLLALYALDHELKRIPFLVSEPMLGAIRFQWWRDTIGSIYEGQQPGHEIVPALTAAIRECDLPPAAFHRWIDAREDELEETPFPDIGAARDHAAASDGIIADLGCRLLGEGNDFDGANAYGAAFGLVSLARGAGAAAGRRALLLPLDTLEAAGETADHVFAGHGGSGADAAFGAILDAAEETLRQARAVSPPKHVLPALMPAALVPAYCRLMRGKQFDMFRTPPDIPAFRRQLALMARAMRGRI